MTSLMLQESELTAFEGAVAGHHGVLIDPSGALVIKPCTPSEISFYEKSNSDHPEFAEILPVFMGTLGLSTPEQRKALQNPDPMSINAALQAQEGTAEKMDLSSNGTSFGAKIDATQAIVLENVAAGFVKPNIMDIKLGKRLWGEDAASAKRVKLDKVSAETTSGSHGFRIAGMRVWRPDDAGKGDWSYEAYGKAYGRSLSTANVRDGFEEFFYGHRDGTRQLTANRRTVLEFCADEVARIQTVLEGQECRMYSASILIVAEGEDDALERAMTSMETMQQEHEEKSDKDEEGSEEGALSRAFAVKLIDFAHATWTPGQGPDENLLLGVRSLRDILESMASG